jgi:TM2 domain-containing membrane protein YozV
MKQEQILIYSYTASFAASILGALLKIMHGQGGETLLIISFLLLLVFIITASREVNASVKIPSSEKSMWIIGFVFMSLIAGIVYLKQGRRRVIG